MSNPDLPAPDDFETTVSISSHQYEASDLRHICEMSVPCVNFLMAPVMDVRMEPDGIPQSADVQVLVTIAGTDGDRIAVTFPLVAFDAFVEMANDVKKDLAHYGR